MTLHPTRVAKLATLAALVGVIAAGAAYALSLTSPEPEIELTAPEVASRDLEAIEDSGVLRVAVIPDQITWTIHRGRPEGLGRDLVADLAADLGLALEIVRPPSAPAGLRDVVAGEADLLVVSDSGPRPVVADVAWTEPLFVTQPTLLGRTAGEIRSVDDLRDRRISVRRHSALERVAFAWQRQLDGALHVERAPADRSDRDLALAAARGEEDLVLLDEHRARLELAVYKALTMSEPLGAPLAVRWAIRPDHEALSTHLDTFIDASRKSGRLAELERIYLENPERLRARRLPPFREKGPALSPWDGLFRASAQRHGFDWRLLAALCFAESGYDPWQVSRAGAIGLLQLMPETAAAFGADDPFDPGQNVEAGARHLRWLYDLYEGVEDPHRLAFALAAYNVGLGHVADVRGMAAERGLDPDLWHGHVAEVLPLKEDLEIAEKTSHGFARGSVTRRYVNHVLDLYGRFTRADQQARAVTPDVPDAH